MIACASLDDGGSSRLPAPTHALETMRKTSLLPEWLISSRRPSTSLRPFRTPWLAKGFANLASVQHRLKGNGWLFPACSTYRGSQIYSLVDASKRSKCGRSCTTVILSDVKNLVPIILKFGDSSRRKFGKTERKERILRAFGSNFLVVYWWL